MGMWNRNGTIRAFVPSMLVALSGSVWGDPPPLPFPAALDLYWLDAPYGLRIDGIDANDRSGHSVSGAGDVNGDGIDDVLIGAPYASPGGRSGAGETYIVYGRADLTWQGPIALSGWLNGTLGFVLNGISAGDQSGGSVSSGGDVNGDGFGDVVIGARRVDRSYYEVDVGEAYVVFGGPTAGAGGSINLSSLNGSNGFILRGIDSYDESGCAVSSAGDVNGDGFDDVIVGALRASPNGQFWAGKTYVVFGGSTVGAGGSIALASLNGANGFVINGITMWDLSGMSVSSAGDVNGDEYGDLLIGAGGVTVSGQASAGGTYVVFGGPGVGAGGSVNLSSLNGSNGFVLNGVDYGDLSGFSVSAGGDVNADGADDLIIGARDADANGQIDAGETYIAFGGIGIGAGGSVELSSLNGVNGFVLNGVGAESRSSWSVSAAGDVNHDGVGDIIVGARFAASNGKNQAGETYVVFGGPGVGAGGSMDLSSVNGVTGFRVFGIDAFDLSGTSVSAAGDVNGDGADDVIIGAPQADPGGRLGAGETYIVCGRSALPPPACIGDVNANGVTNVQDFNILASNFGANVPPGTNGDLTGDGLVNVSDFNIVAGDLGCGF